MDSGYPNLARWRVRLRRTLCATDANRDPGRLTAVYPPPRKPLASIRRRSPTLRARSKPSCHGPPRWTRSRCRQPKSITWSLAACRSPPSVQLTPKVLVRQALSRSDRPARPYRVMAPGPRTRGATLPDSVTVDTDTWSGCSGRAQRLTYAIISSGEPLPRDSSPLSIVPAESQATAPRSVFAAWRKRRKGS